MEKAEACVRFLNSSRSAFHAVDSSRKLLSETGFVQLHERDPTSFAKIQPGGKYLFTRNQSSLVAFAVGKKWKNGNAFTMIGAHTDSPCLKIKPISNIVSYGYCEVGVETYGGGLWYTWFDRNLSLAGRVFVSTSDGKYQSQLIDINKPLLFIPSLAIHLDRTANEAFKFNMETNLLPVLGSVVKETLGKVDNDNHNAGLISLIASTLEVAPSQVHNFELSLCDYQEATIGGINNEYIFSGRIDNLVSSYCAVKSLCESSLDGSLDEDETVRCVVLFDNEEVGSRSAYGAMSPLLEDAIQRICDALSGESMSSIHATKSNSFLISADMAHAVHPNYGSKHENNHRPAINGGPTIKLKASQQYATTCETSLVIELLCKKHKIPYQKFIVRNDSPCGSTIGPIVSSCLGVRTVDIGCPQLAMHSIRETCGVDDVGHYIDLFNAFFHDFSSVDKNISFQ
eukprot:TRINITY_DN14186_c0_g1_i2.p1 TRINITY_DN14186_c0_g1~~TRINITY_DN14186_c0_g1_i2.p1  ORF type:complete len:456 (-),score=80.82 TRINITY_DN14186_c0_g1_i2:114-1481(-)